MSTPERINALRRANPRNEAGFAESVEAATGLVRHVVASAGDIGAPRRSRRRLLGVSAAAAALVAVAAVVAIRRSARPASRAPPLPSRRLRTRRLPPLSAPAPSRCE